MDRPPLNPPLIGAPADRSVLTSALTSAPPADVAPPPTAVASEVPGSRPSAAVLLFLGGLVMSMFSGNSKLAGFPVAPDRLLIGSSLVLLAITARRNRGWTAGGSGVLALMAATVAWVIMSGLAADSLLDSYGFFALLDRIVLPFVFFTVAGRLFGDLRSRELLLRVLVLLGLYLGATAIFEVLGPQALVFPRYIADPDVGIVFGRARGPFLVSDADGLVMITCGTAAVLAAVRWRGAWRVVAVVTSLCCALGAILTLTRSIWVGAVLALVLAGWSASRLRRWLPLVLALVGVGVFAALNLLPGLQEDAAARAGSSRSLYDRANTDAAAIRIVEDRPLTGVGWMRFADVSPDYVRQAVDYPITNIRIEVHNVVLGRAAELGLPGAALWVLCVLVGPVAAAVSRVRGDPDVEGWRLVLIAALTSWLVAIMVSPVPYALPNFLVWLLGGLVAACGRERPAAPRTGPPRHLSS